MWDEPPKSVLVIQTAFIGDVVLTIPLLEAIKILWVETELDVMVRPPSDNLLETLPFIRRVWVYDKRGIERGLCGFLKWRRVLSRQKYDLAIIPQRYLRSALLAKSAKIPIRIGFNRGSGRIFHTIVVPYKGYQHEILRNLDLLSPFGPLPQVDPPVTVPTEEDLHVVNEKLGNSEGKSFAALAPGSVWFTKRWPEVYYKELCRSLMSSGYRVVLIGGAEDRALCSRIAAAIGRSALNLAGELTLRQSVEVLRRCAFLVTNDSAPTHLGVAAGTRVLTVFGSTIPDYGFGPYGAQNRTVGVEIYCRPCTDHGRKECPEKHFRCLREITPERVFQEIQIMLEQHQA